MSHPNYLEGTNPFKLAGPPSWFLRALWDFDSSLVIVPSKQDCVYRLAQRRRPNLSDAIVNESLFASSDTKMLASYSLVPVTTILSTATWSPQMLQELANRAPHRNGGAEVVNRRFDDLEREEELKKAKEQDLRNTHYAQESWKRYRKHIGLGRTIFT